MKGIRERRDIFYHSFYDDPYQWFLIQLMQPNQRSCSQLENLNNNKKKQTKTRQLTRGFSIVPMMIVPVF